MSSSSDSDSSNSSSSSSEEEVKATQTKPQSQPVTKKDSDSESESSSSSEEAPKNDKKESESESSDSEPEGPPKTVVASPKEDDNRSISKGPTTPALSKPASVMNLNEDKKSDDKVKREELDKAIALLKEESSSKEIAQKLEDDKEGKLRGKDIVPQLIKIVKSNEENSNIVSGSLLAIRWLKDDQALKYEFRTGGGFPVLVDLFNSKNENIRRAVVRFTGDTITKCGTSDNLSNSEAFVSAGGAPLVVKLLGDKDNHIQSMCAGVIRVLCGYEGRVSNTSFQEEFKSGGAVKPLLALLKLESTDMIRQSCGAIRAMSDGNSSNREEFVKNGAISILLKHLESQSDVKVQNHVLNTIYTLTVQNPSAGVELVKNGGLEKLVNEFKSEFVEKHELVLGIWKNICVDNNEMQTVVRDKGILDIVIETVNANTPSSDKPEATSTKSSGTHQPLNGKEKVQKSACSALGAMTANNAVNNDKATKANVLENLVKYIALHCDPVVSRALTAIRSLVTKNKTNQTKLFELRALPKLIELLSSKSLEVRDGAVSVIAQSVSHEKLRKELTKNAVPAILRILDPLPNIDALAVLQVLVEDEQVKTEVTQDTRALHRLVTFLDDNNEKVLINTCAVLSTLSIRNKKGQSNLMKAGVAPKLVRLLGVASYTIQHHASYTMWAVAKNTTRSQKELGKYKALEALVKIIKDESSTDVLKEYASGAIYAIVIDYAKNKKHIGQIGGIEALLPLLSSASTKVKVNAAKTLWAICEASSSSFGSKEMGFNQDKSAHGIPSLVRMLKTDKHTLQAASGSAVYAVVHRNTKNQNSAREAGAFPPLVDIVKLNTKDYQTSKNSSQVEAVKWAVLCIGSLAYKNNNNVNQLVKEGAVEAVEALRDSRIDVIAKAASNALNNLGAKKSGRKEPKKVESKKEEPKKVEPKKVEEVKKEEPKKQEVKPTKQESSDSETSNSSSSSDEEPPKQPVKTPVVETPKEEPKKEEPKPQESSSESSSSSSESSSEDEVKEQPLPKQQEPVKIEEPKVVEAPKEEPKEEMKAPSKPLEAHTEVPKEQPKPVETAPEKPVEKPVAEAPKPIAKQDSSAAVKRNRTISDEELAILRKVFAECDSDGSGAIDQEELKKLVIKLGITEYSEDAKIAEAFKLMDLSGDGTINFREFIAGAPEWLLNAVKPKSGPSGPVKKASVAAPAKPAVVAPKKEEPKKESSSESSSSESESESSSSSSDSE